MATYCYRCKTCGATRALSVREPFTYCTCDGRPKMTRDYRAEAVNVGPNVMVSKRSLENL